ncbi:hypothetical protein KSP39_PZI011097 [Platanthera zijinensis]|uniref:Uncharacterized protein n=1 Tax=Platanthera zijinensis TaxID=2320716 RepID=A0AAP0BGN2_9ASPA
MREYRLLDYFKQCFSSSLNIKTNKELTYALTSIPPYQVHFFMLKFCIFIVRLVNKY